MPIEKLNEMIQELNSDPSTAEQLPGLAELLEEKKADLSPEASQEEVTEAIKSCLDQYHKNMIDSLVSQFEETDARLAASENGSDSCDDEDDLFIIDDDDDDEYQFTDEDELDDDVEEDRLRRKRFSELMELAARERRRALGLDVDDDDDDDDDDGSVLDMDDEDTFARRRRSFPSGLRGRRMPPIFDSQGKLLGEDDDEDDEEDFDEDADDDLEELLRMMEEQDFSRQRNKVIPQADIICESFKEHHLRFSRSDGHAGTQVIELGIAMPHMQLNFHLTVSAEPNTLLFDYSLPISVDREYEYPLSLVMAKLNALLPFGSFSVSPVTNQICLKYLYPYGKHNVDPEIVREIMGNMVHSCELHCRVLRRFSVGKLSSSERKEAMRRLNALKKDLNRF